MNDLKPRLCTVCDTPLKKGLSSWHFYCPNCGYEGSSLQSNINEEVVSEPLDEESRKKGLKTLRTKNFRLLAKILNKYQPREKRLLDVGSAHGWFLENTQSSFAVVGIEPDRKLASKVGSKGYDVVNGFFPDDMPANEKFDIITFNDVFEHIENSDHILEACSQRLNPDGIVLLNLPSSGGLFYRLSKILYRVGFKMPFIRMWQVGMPSPHIHYFNKRNLHKLLSDQNFEVVEDGTLPSLVLEGLSDRISFSGNMGLILKTIVLAGIILIYPLVKLTPSDIIFVVARRTE